MIGRLVGNKNNQLFLKLCNEDIKKRKEKKRKGE